MLSFDPTERVMFVVANVKEQVCCAQEARSGIKSTKNGSERRELSCGKATARVQENCTDKRAVKTQGEITEMQHRMRAKLSTCCLVQCFLMLVLLPLCGLGVAWGGDRLNDPS